MREHGGIRVEAGLYVIGALLLVNCLWAGSDGCIAQGRLAARLRSLLAPGRSGLAGGVARATREESRGSGLVGRIEIPRLRFTAMIVEGTSSRALRRGVGHVERTAFPGEAGNVALAGHRDTFFRPLAGIREGDTIRLRTPDGSFTYRVRSTMVVGPERSDLLRRTRTPTLTLVTCYPFDWIGPAPDRFVVRAAEVSPAAAPEVSATRRTVARFAAAAWNAADAGDAAALAPYGRWVEVAGRGRCWRPEVPREWRPYHDGQWVHTATGWAWETEEPWGRIVYHAGTWVDDPSWGWVWSPAGSGAVPGHSRAAAKRAHNQPTTGRDSQAIAASSLQPSFGAAASHLPSASYTLSRL